MAPASRRLWLALVLAVLAGCAAAEPAQEGQRRAGPVTRPIGRWAQQYHWLPVVEADGTARLILARTCHPGGTGPRRLVVINHGKSPVAAVSAAFVPPTCDAEPVRWFLERGFAVILPVRRGYGASGGPMAEAYPRCVPSRDYVVGALETARDIRAAITYATRLPGVAPTNIVVVGQSAGGLGTIALSSLRDGRVAALVNMAGGDGGHMNEAAQSVCEPSSLVRAAARFGTSARSPMLWVYIANDSFFSPDLAEAMHRAYTAGGGQARLASLPAWGTDGHLLFTGLGGTAVWGPLVEQFLGLKPIAATGSALWRH